MQAHIDLDAPTVRQYWDPIRKMNAVNIAPGGYYVTRKKEMLGAVLGSCIAACIRDPQVGLGGMNHFMLPGTCTQHLGELARARYGSFAMEQLINNILKLGGSKSRLEIKIFGGANVLGIDNDIGAQNIEFVKQYLGVENLQLANQDVGETYPRKLRYFPHSGQVQMKRLPSTEAAVIRAREQTYAEQMVSGHKLGSVELFGSHRTRGTTSGQA